LLDVACQLYDACEEDTLRGAPGEIISRRHGAVCRATRDGAVWIGHVKKIVPGEKTFKLPATLVLHDRLGAIPEAPLAFDVPPSRLTYKDIWYEEKAGWVPAFRFYNGAERRTVPAPRRGVSRPAGDRP
jgi:putative two-component system hydrogenase maturation factor HypX/HoxX